MCICVKSSRYSPIDENVEQSDISIYYSLRNHEAVNDCKLAFEMGQEEGGKTKKRF